MPDNKPLLGLKSAGIQADPDWMTQFRSQHPWIAKTADILTGGATDPYSRPGPLDVVSAAAPALGALRLVRGAAPMEEAMMGLRETPHIRQALRRPVDTAMQDPAIQALTEADYQRHLRALPNAESIPGVEFPAEDMAQGTGRMLPVKDLMENQGGLDWMHQQFELNNPGFKQMEAQGLFKGAGTKR